MQIKYVAEPTLTALHNDRGYFFQYIEGPFGSGKSSGVMMEIMMRAARQQPDANKVRKSRWAVVRNTYPELKTTTIKTWQDWVPDAIAPVVYSVPYNCKFRQKLADGTRIDLEVYFMALDTEEDVKKLLSLELTGAYLNEAREIPYAIFEGLGGRINRYPKTIKDTNGKTVYGPTEPGILADSNPPNVKHWLYTTFESGATPKEFKRYIQPPAVYWDEAANSGQGAWALNPDAENLLNLADDYYAKQMLLGDEHIRINLAGENGMTRKGTPIFKKFNTKKHVAENILLPTRGMTILIGMDFGLTPAAVLGQLSGRGLTFLDELPTTDESLEDFLDDYVLPMLRNKYGGYSYVVAGDPAGFGRSPIDKRTAFQVLNSRGLVCANPVDISNAFKPRKDAVDFFLGREGGFVVSPHLAFLREALAAGYVWKETKNAQGVHLDVAVKNEYSHIADALQYLCLYARRGGATGRQGRPPAAQPKRHKWA